MEENKEIKSFAEIEKENEEKLNQFMFVVFLSNPITRTVKFGVDGDMFTSVMSTDKFLDIIEKTCGYKEKNKIENACYEYGIPYLYDRVKNHLTQMVELPPERKLEFTADYHKEFESQKTNLLDKDGIFQQSTSVFEKYRNIGLPKF